MQTLLADLRFGIRQLWKSPGFAAIAILALTLGIGANTAIFSAIDAVLLRPLPYADPDRLVAVWEDASHFGFARNTPAPANYADWKRQNQVFSGMAALRGHSANLTGDGAPELVFGQRVSADMFAVLGIRPLRGRAFTEQEDRDDARVVVLSYGLWKRRFAADPALVGKTIQMNGEQYAVIGVLPRGVQILQRDVEYWVPGGLTPQDFAKRGFHFLRVVARLKPGVALERARAEMTSIAQRLERQYPETNTKVGAVVVPLKEEFVGDTRLALIVLLCGAGCVLLIACANIANLLLARSTARRGEMAVRAALGAGRVRLLCQMVTESVLLSGIGGALGLLLARWSLTALQRLVPPSMTDSALLSLDARVLLFSAAISMATGLAFGLIPALQTSRLDLHDQLKQGGRGGVGGGSRIFRGLLVVSEVAMALVLLVGAGLLIRTLFQLRAIDTGFRPESLLTARTILPKPKYSDPAKRVAFYASVLSRVRTLPGVVSAAYISNLPFTARGNTSGFVIEGRPAPAPGDPSDALFRVGTADYLKTIGARLIEGRLPDSRDRDPSRASVVINRTFAQLHWSGSSPVGGRIQVSRTGPKEPWQTIIGVVDDVRERGLELGLKPGVYLVVDQVADAWAVPSEMAIRTSVDPLTLAGAVRDAVWAVDRDQPVTHVRTMDDIVDLDFAARKQQMILLGAFAALALILASIGIYGVLSYLVTQRTREIGVRIALGATSADIARLVARQGLALALCGLAAGTVIALGATRVMQGLLYGVAAADPRTYLSVAAILALVAWMACYLPARRAARIDPMRALRDE